MAHVYYTVVGPLATTMLRRKVTVPLKFRPMDTTVLLRLTDIEFLQLTSRRADTRLPYTPALELQFMAWNS